MVSIEISSARLVPVAGDSGWLCRFPSAVVWAPGNDDGVKELISTCSGASSAAQLLGRVASHLADPDGSSWPPFAILAEKGHDVVVVVHGPVEVVVDHDAGPSKLFGGEEVGSWLNRLIKNPTGASCSLVEDLDPVSDLRNGVVRAGGFALLAAGARASVGSEVSEGIRAAQVQEREVRARAAQERAAQERAAQERAAQERAAQVAPAVQVRSVRREAEVFSEAESPTVVEQPAVSPTDATIVEAEGGLFTIGESVSPKRSGGRLGRLTWDNGEVHELAGPVLVGRDVSSDEAVISGKLLPIVPDGQNDSMSRVHAEISGRGADVVVVDRGSTNGTFVWDETAKAWQRLTAGQPQVIAPGTVLAFGERTATFETSAR